MDEPPLREDLELPPPDLLLPELLLLPEELPEERVVELFPELDLDPLLLLLLTLEPELLLFEPLLLRVFDFGFTVAELPFREPLLLELFRGLTELPEELPLRVFRRGSTVRPVLRPLF